MNNICFVIAHRYYRTHVSYIKHYVDNIQKYYGQECLTMIVDNNSLHIQDIRDLLSDYKNVLVLDNDTECKFEVGAYRKGIQYLIDNNLLDNYEYFVFSQDTFVLKNKVDFNELMEKNVKACPFAALPGHRALYEYPLIQDIMRRINVSPDNPDINICWCVSFILHSTKVIEFHEIIKDIVIKIRIESELSERYMSPILYHLNGNKKYALDDNCCLLEYDCWKVDIFTTQVKHYFVKHVQRKTEMTTDA